MEPGRNRRNRGAPLDAGRSIGGAFGARELRGRARRNQPLTPLRAAAAAVRFELSDRALGSLPGRCSRCAAR